MFEDQQQWGSSSYDDDMTPERFLRLRKYVRTALSKFDEDMLISPAAGGVYGSIVDDDIAKSNETKVWESYVLFYWIKSRTSKKVASFNRSTTRIAQTRVAEIMLHHTLYKFHEWISYSLPSCPLFWILTGLMG
jgi:hypothetical protein